jgi:hypothetical protein
VRRQDRNFPSMPEVGWYVRGHHTIYCSLTSFSGEKCNSAFPTDLPGSHPVRVIFVCLGRDKTQSTFATPTAILFRFVPRHNPLPERQNLGCLLLLLLLLPLPLPPCLSLEVGGTRRLC